MVGDVTAAADLIKLYVILKQRFLVDYKVVLSTTLSNSDYGWMTA
jgi:hypothetical protein